MSRSGIILIHFFLVFWSGETCCVIGMDQGGRAACGIIMGYAAGGGFDMRPVFYKGRCVIGGG